MANSVNKFSEGITCFFATCAGTGFLPKFAGTLASALSAGAVALAGRAEFAWWSFGLSGGIGLLISKKAAALFRDKDPGCFVLDEWAGMALSLLGVPLKTGWVLFGFVLFRFFDVVKPLGIRKIDRWDSSGSIMLDDLLAGLYVNLILHGVMIILK